MKRMITVGGLVVGLSAAAAGVAFAAGGGAPNTPAEDRAEQAFTADHRADAAVSEQDATATALAAHPGGTATDVHLEDEENGLVWEVKPDVSGTVYEVQVDAATGQIVSDHLDD